MPTKRMGKGWFFIEILVEIAKVDLEKKRENGAHRGKGNCIMVLYEDLVLSTEIVMRKTMKFIGEDFHPMMLDHTSGMDQIKVAPNGLLGNNHTFSFNPF